MFMFRSKRNTLTRRLWKARVVPDKSQDDTEIKSSGQALLKRLSERQLELLLTAVETKGAETGECVLLAKGPMQMGKKKVSPEVLCCQLWRWLDMDGECEIKRLPCCRSANDPVYTCCNPYHWSRVFIPGKL